MKITTIAVAAAAALFVGAQAASAVTISVTAGGTADEDRFVGGFAVETFENFQPVQDSFNAGVLETAVGDFTALPGAPGSGHTVVGAGPQHAIKPAAGHDRLQRKNREHDHLPEQQQEKRWFRYR